VPRRCILNCGRRARTPVRLNSPGQWAELRRLRLHDGRVCGANRSTDRLSTASPPRSIR